MKNFKTLLALLLALVMVFALAACGAKDEVKEPDKDPVENNKPADDDKPADAGNDDEESYGTYTIGQADENFYGVTMNVGTYANIFTGGTATTSILPFHSACFFSDSFA